MATVASNTWLEYIGETAGGVWHALSISGPMSMTRLVQLGIVLAEQPRPGLPTVIKREDLKLDHVMRAVSQLKTSNTRPLSVDPNQRNLFENRDS